MGPPVPARLRRALLTHLRDPQNANGYALVLNAGVSALLGLVFWLLAARRFSAADLGFGAAVVSASTLAALLGKAGFDAALIRYLPHASRRGERRLLAWSTLASLALTSLVCLVLLALAGRGIEDLAPLRTPLAAGGFLLLAAGTVTAWMADAFFVAHQVGHACLARNVVFNGVKLLVPLLLATSLAAYAVPLAWGVGLSASLALTGVLLSRHMGHAEAATGTTARKEEVFAYAVKNYALNLSEFLPGLVLPLLVIHMMGAEANAHFFLAWTTATVAFLASKAIAQSAFSALVREGDARPALRKGFLLSLLVIAPGGGVLLFAAPLLLGIFGPGYGTHGAGLLRILALSLAPLAVSNLFLAYLKARAASAELTLMPVLGLLALLLSFPPALSRWGIEGAGLAWLAVQLVFGTYAAGRLAAIHRRSTHAKPGTHLRARAHQG